MLYFRDVQGGKHNGKFMFALEILLFNYNTFINKPFTAIRKRKFTSHRPIYLVNTLKLENKMF